MRRLVALLAIVALLGAMPKRVAHPPAQTRHVITIVINGDTLSLEPPPIWHGGRLMVPVRRTIEALGLTFNKEGKRIWTQVGAKTVDLTGPTAEIHDVLYAPLRFFTDVLGAQANYDRKTNSVNIVAQLVGRSGVGQVTSGKNVERFGTVTAVDTDSDPPTITLAYNAAVKTIHITRNAQIDMRDVGANVTVPGELGDIRPGDFARVYMDKNGHVSRVEDAFGSRNGTVAATAGGVFVLSDGHVITPSRTTRIMLNGKPAQVSDLQLGDSVTVRYNVETNEVREALASRPVSTAPAAAGGVKIDRVDLDADRPLRARDMVNVTMHGTPGGAAMFDIGSYVTNVAMSERAPGTYAGAYQLPAGANFSDVPIIGHLRANGVDAPDVQSERSLSASSSPPGISDFAPDENAVVDTNRPAIYATFSADAVPVNPSSIVMWVNGRDVTANCVRSPQFIQYVPSYTYPTGPVRVTVRVADRAGNTTMKSWSFEIKTR
jgi:hypothetical protein